MLRTRPSISWSASTYKWVMIVSALATAAAGSFAMRLAWQPRTDFDILGVLFLMQNLPKLIVSAAALGCAATAAGCFVKWRAGGD